MSNNNFTRKIFGIHGNRKFICFVFLFMETLQSLFTSKGRPNVFVNMENTQVRIKGFISTWLSRIISAIDCSFCFPL